MLPLAGALYGPRIAPGVTPQLNIPGHQLRVIAL